jgi:hypothetical protein
MSVGRLEVLKSVKLSTVVLATVTQCGLEGGDQSLIGVFYPESGGDTVFRYIGASRLHGVATRKTTNCNIFGGRLSSKLLVMSNSG